MKKTPDQIFQEYLKARIEGKEISPEELVKRYPEHKEYLLRKIAALDIIPMPSDKDLHADDFSGRRVGDFRLIRQIGRGGMGSVYLAEQISLKRKVALKFINASIFAKPKNVERFHKEGQAIAKLEHKGIVPVYTVGEYENNFYIAMQYVKGLPLSRLIEYAYKNKLTSIEPEKVRELIASELQDEESKNIKAPPGRNWKEIACSIIASVAEAVEYAHKQHILHRDIKPSNIILTKEGQAVLLDFGLCKDLEAPDVTLTEELIGTPSYSSPEQLFGKPLSRTARSDVYSLGVTLYELLTFNLPYKGDSVADLLSSIKSKEPISPRKFNAKLPKDLNTIILKAIDKNPDKRYDTAEAILRDINHFLNYEPIEAKPVAIYKKAIKYVKRNKITVSLVSILIVAFIISGGLFIFHQKSRIRARVAEMKQLIDEANNYFTIHGLDKEAINLYEKAITISNNHIDAINALAYAYCQKGIHKFCIKYSKIVLDKDEHNVEAFYNIGKSLIERNKYDEAITFVKDWIKNNENNAYGYELLARVYASNNMKDEALSNIDKALKISPRNSFIAGMKATICTLFEDIDCAFKYYKMAVELEPNSATAWSNLAMHYNLHKSAKEALPIIEKALELNTFDANVRHLYATTLLHLGKGEQALRESIVTTTLFPNNYKCWESRSLIEYTIGQYDEGIKSFERAKSISPELIPDLLLYSACKMYYSANQISKSMECVNEGMEKYPSNHKYKILRAQLYMTEEKYNKALNIVNKLLKENIEEPYCYTILGEIHYKKKEYNEAIKYSKKALKLNPTSTVARFTLIKSYKKLGMSKKARNELKMSMQYGGDKYENKELNIMFAAPMGWKKMEKSPLSHQNMIIAYELPEEDDQEGYMQLGYNIAEPVDLKERFDDEYFKEYLESMYGDYVNILDISSSVKKEGGNTIVEIIANVKVSDEKGVILSRWIIGKGVNVNLSTYLNSKAYSAYEDLVKHSLQTLEFLK